ncbi:MAG: hypothetical protein PHE79_01800 [Eubacteriales bacterium]|nr:hypothetical protein [Eubacteriales bacterium]
MNIIENENDKVTIDGIRIEGFISDDRCKVCNQNLILYKKYDALFCPECNQWAESKCSDPDCVYCRNRPDKPLER